MQANAIAIGQLDHLVMLHHLQVVETHRDQPEHGHNRGGQNRDSRLELRDRTVLWFGAKLRHGTFPSIIYSRAGPTGNPVSRLSPPSSAKMTGANTADITPSAANCGNRST